MTTNKQKEDARGAFAGLDIKRDYTRRVADGLVNLVATLIDAARVGQVVERVRCRPVVSLVSVAVVLVFVAAIAFVGLAAVEVVMIVCDI